MPYVQPCLYVYKAVIGPELETGHGHGDEKRTGLERLLISFRESLRALIVAAAPLYYCANPVATRLDRRAPTPFAIRRGSVTG